MSICPQIAQGLAAPRTVADNVSGPTTTGARVQPFERSEPTRANPVRTAVLAQEVNSRGAALGGRDTHTVDSNSHGPWYEQDPTGGHDIFDEEEKPSVVGRAAIGVAVAAILSVVVFGVLRMGSNPDEVDRHRTSADRRLNPNVHLAHDGAARPAHGRQPQNPPMFPKGKIPRRLPQKPQALASSPDTTATGRHRPDITRDGTPPVPPAPQRQVLIAAPAPPGGHRWCGSVLRVLARALRHVDAPAHWWAPTICRGSAAALRAVR